MSENIGNLSQALVSSMEILAKSGDQALTFDKTIECDIIKIADPATGEYKVKYLNGTISAYDVSLEMKYKAGDQVYVQVPQNDMSLKKLILGRKSTNASDLVDVILDTERVDKIGLPLEDIYKISTFTNEVGIIGSTLSGRGFTRTLFNNNNSMADIDKLLQNYANGQSLLLIEAQFKTSWFEIINKGNYGLEIVFSLKGNAGDQVIILDRQSMRGNSLRYDSWVSVTGLLNIEGEKIEKLKSVKLFSEDFISRKMDEEDLQEHYVKGDYEIFVKNISISFVQEAKTLGYTVNVQTPDGIYFHAVNEEKDEIRLNAVFKYNGQLITNSGIKYFWYRKNARINTSHASFDELGGVGWEPIGNNEQTLVITQDTFGTSSVSQMYKVVAKYEEYICEDDVIIYQTTDSDDYELYLTKSTNNIGKLTLRKITGDGKVNFGDNVIYMWSSVSNNGLVTYYDETPEQEDYAYVSDEGLSLSQIHLNGIIGTSTYYCNVFTSTGVPIVTIFTQIKNIQTQKDFDVIFLVDNDGFYSYDAKGDYVSENLNKKIDFQIVWKDNQATAFHYQWIPTTDIETGADGKEFLSYKNKMFEGNSEILDGDVDPSLQNSSTQEPFYFSVKNRFYAEKAENNIIQLNIIIDGITYSFRKNLTFLKEGASGTNGTSLMIKVEPAEDSDVALYSAEKSAIKLKCVLYYNGQTTYGNKTINSCFKITCSVPRDYWGERGNGKYLNPFIQDITNEGITSPQEVIHFKVDTKDPTCTYITIQNKKDLIFNLNKVSVDGANFNSIIQITCTPNGSSDNFNYNLYKLYGVPLVSHPSDIAKYFVTGAKEIVYDQNGFNPKYSESEYKIYADTNASNLATFVNFGYYADSEGFSISNKILTPWTYYSKKQLGAIYYSFDSQYYVQPLIFTVNLFSEKLLNAWDGASLQIDEKAGTVIGAQIGAGEKDKDNKFTGVLMGSYSQNLNLHNEITSKTGLLGFSKGEASFGLLDSGDAFFGKSGLGRILFRVSGTNPQAIIESGGYIASDFSGQKKTYVTKTVGGITFQPNEIEWDKITTSNIVISFDANAKTNRGFSLRDFSVGAAGSGQGTITQAPYFKIKLKYSTIIKTKKTRIVESISGAGEYTYTKEVNMQTESTVSDLFDGSFMTTESRTIVPVEGENGAKSTKEEYDSAGGVTTSEKVSEIAYEYWLYVYNATASPYTYEYVRVPVKDSTGKEVITRLTNDDEIYTGETFKIHTSEETGQGMQINLTTGEINAADLKLQSSSIYINSNYNNIDDYAIKIGANNSNAFYITHSGKGKIGGWTITQDTEGKWYLTAGKTMLTSAGSIIGAYISGGEIEGGEINGTDISANSLTATLGEIGGWDISGGVLSGTFSKLSSSGYLKMGDASMYTILSTTGISLNAKLNGSTTERTLFSAGAGGIYLYAGELVGSSLDFYFSKNGLELIQNRKTDADYSKIKLGWNTGKDEKGLDIVYPYLRLGAGGTSTSSIFWIEKSTRGLWFGNTEHTLGIFAQQAMNSNHNSIFESGEQKAKIIVKGSEFKFQDPVEITGATITFKAATTGITAKLVT